MLEYHIVFILLYYIFCKDRLVNVSYLSHTLYNPSLSHAQREGKRESRCVGGSVLEIDTESSELFIEWTTASPVLCCCYFYHRSCNYLRVSDVTTATANSVPVAMGDDDYVILNGDLSFYAPPPTTNDPSGVGSPGRCTPWLGVLDPRERAVFVDLDQSFKERYDVITCTVQATPSTTASRRHHKASWQHNCYHLLSNYCIIITFYPWKIPEVCQKLDIKR